MSKAQIVDEIHRSARKNFLRRKVILKDIDDLWQADLIDMQTYSNVNKKYRFILVVIDGFSKYGWAYPLKSKTKTEVAKVFENLLQKNRVPCNLQTDLGTEFYNNTFSNLMKKYNINHYSTFSTMKASIAERFIRTLKSKLYKAFSMKGNYTWIDSTLNNAITDYNNTIHRTIGCKPIEINKSNSRALLLRYASQLSNYKVRKNSNLHINDFVRISKHKSCFEKGYTPNWSTEIFKVIKVQKTLPVTYLVEDMRKQPILGSFYREELQKTSLSDIYLVEKVIKKKGDKVFVKWLGLPKTENCWISKNNVLK